ncbi:MAG: orotidine-5'-phosphate decarboxylase [Sulfolobales archaeon]
MSIIVALDPPARVLNRDRVFEWLRRNIEETRDLVQGFKLGLPLLLAGGVDSYAYARKLARDRMIIADLKLADIGDIMSLSIEYLADIGVDAVIVHSFVGVKNGLDKALETGRSRGVKIIQVVSMSHEGSREFIDSHLREFLEIAKRNSVWGVVAPATRLDVIRLSREVLGRETKILAPGVGVQGAEPGAALCAGADYEIIGRAITSSTDPRSRVLEFIERQLKMVRECKTL